MKDHAQAKIELIDWAIKAANQIKIEADKPLTTSELACWALFRIAVRAYCETKEANRVADDEDFDSLHGAG